MASSFKISRWCRKGRVRFRIHDRKMIVEHGRLLSSLPSRIALYKSGIYQLCALEEIRETCVVVKSRVATGDELQAKLIYLHLSVQLWSVRVGNASCFPYTTSAAQLSLRVSRIYTTHHHEKARVNSNNSVIVDSTFQHMGHSSRFQNDGSRYLANTDVPIKLTSLSPLVISVLGTLQIMSSKAWQNSRVKSHAASSPISSFALPNRCIAS